MSSVSELYQSVILEHNRKPKNYGRLEGEGVRHADGYNPLCGDRVSVWLSLDGDVVRDVRFEGQGCAISKASASLMTAAVQGKTLSEIDELFHRFHGLVTGKLQEGEAHMLPGKLRVFGGVAQFPVRVKCASLAWHALRAALGAAEGAEPAEAAVIARAEGPKQSPSQAQELRANP